MHIVDSHQHFWQLARGDYGWLTSDLDVLYQDFLPAQYKEATSGLDVSKTVLVQAADTVAETEFMLGLANDIPWIGGVVGWIDMEATGALTELERLATHSCFRGIRPMLQDIEDTDWIMNPAFGPILKSLAEKGLTFDALIQPRHLANIAAIASGYPELKIVIDHCAKPDVVAAQYDDWAEALAAFDSLENVYVKFSGLTTEAAETDHDPETYRPYFDHLQKVFGTRRIMWGSDWPVVKMNGEFGTWVEICRALTMGLPAADQQAFWVGNSKKFYNLNLEQEV